MGGSARIRIISGALIAMTGLVLALPASAESTTVTYTANITIPVPPASNFAGSAGGDGWDVALTPTAVYNVFHHNFSQLEVACHLQVDASKCWDTDSKVITDGSGNNFTGSSHPGLYLDQATGKLYIYSTRTSDSTAGVVCVDTNQPPTNLFCGFTPLSAVGDGGITSIPMKVGSQLYSFNYVIGCGVSGRRRRFRQHAAVLQPDVVRGLREPAVHGQRRCRYLHDAAVPRCPPPPSSVRGSSCPRCSARPPSSAASTRAPGGPAPARGRSRRPRPTSEATARRSRCSTRPAPQRASVCRPAPTSASTSVAPACRHRPECLQSSPRTSRGTGRR